MVKKSTTKSASTAQVINNETKVMCPVCGAEFDVLAPHEHQVKNATVLGVDSGLGTVYLPVSKRGEALKAAGLDTSKYFSIQIPGGGEQLMQKTADGRAVPVSADDPIVKQIMGGGFVPNRNLFRRWVMSQVFHGLTFSGGFAAWLKWHGYKYQWEMLIEELRVQAKLYQHMDMENFDARNRWFNKELAVKMAEDYVNQLREDAKSRKQHKCHGIPYIRIATHLFEKGIFVADIGKKLCCPVSSKIADIRTAKTPQQLYEAVRDFWRAAPEKKWGYKQCPEWKDAYRGAGAYFTMQNLLRFHGCTFPRGNNFYSRKLTGLECLEQAATAYGHDGEGWRLFGLMRQMLEENHIDIKKKMKEWADKKRKV